MMQARRIDLGFRHKIQIVWCTVIKNCSMGRGGTSLLWLGGLSVCRVGKAYLGHTGSTIPR